MENNYQHHDTHKTPPRFLENLHIDIREEINIRHHNQGSPFRCLPINSTPPSRLIKISNPFEAALNERLHLHVFSPSVFSDVTKPKTSDKFKWTIDDVSSLKPAHIDVSTVHQFEQSNPDDEVHVQAKIEKFFSESHIVPSPWNAEVKTSPLISETSPEVNKINKETCDGWTQTVLSLPPVLPNHVEEILRPYFTFTQDQAQDEKNSSLCRRLFNFHDEQSIASSSIISMHSDLSAIGSPDIFESVATTGRNFDSSPIAPLTPGEISPIHNSTPRKLNDCQFSPISSRTDIALRSTKEPTFNDNTLSPISLVKNVSRKCKRVSRLDLSEQMSVDASFNMAPENDHDLHNMSTQSESPLRISDCLESSCNWDMEYKNLSLNSKNIRKTLFVEKRSTSDSSMDISHQYTPKSSDSYPIQRKKISTSYRLFDSDDESHVADDNKSKLRRYNLDEDCKSTKQDGDFLSQNTQDTGYNTELSQRTTCSRNDEDMLVSDISNINENNKENWNVNIFASTPTERFFKDVY